MRRMIVLLLFVAVAIPARSQTIFADSLFSPSLGRVKKFNFLLPQHFDSSKSHPLLLLLHGWGGNYENWASLTGVKSDLGEIQLIIITPDGENSWYVNSNTDPGARFEDYLIKDLIAHVAKKFKIDTSRLAIGGLSMGGYSALVIGLRNPSFRFIAALSASLDVPDGIPHAEKNGRSGLKPSLVTAFGGAPSEFWKSHNPFLLISRFTPSGAPYFYLATGIQDEFPPRLILYRAFSDSLRAHGLHYEYHETLGRHNWEYWDQEIRGILRKLKEFWNL